MQKNRKKIMLATAIMAVSAVVVINTPGCTKHCDNCSTLGFDDPFFPREYSRISDLASYPQAASGARADATLYEIHFFGGKLNSLGEDKLALMLDDDNHHRPTTLYIAAEGNDEDFASRQDAIRTYLASRGMDEGTLRFERGANPGSRTLTAPLIRDLPKTESKSDASAGM